MERPLSDQHWIREGISLNTFLGIMFFMALPFIVLAAIPPLMALGPLVIIFGMIGAAGALLKQGS